MHADSPEARVGSPTNVGHLVFFTASFFEVVKEVDWIRIDSNLSSNKEQYYSFHLRWQISTSSSSHTQDSPAVLHVEIQIPSTLQIGAGEFRM
jgi:hypothetical protein